MFHRRDGMVPHFPRATLLQGAVLPGAVLTGAVLTGAVLPGAVLADTVLADTGVYRLRLVALQEREAKS